VDNDLEEQLKKSLERPLYRPGVYDLCIKPSQWAMYKWTKSRMQQEGILVHWTRRAVWSARRDGAGKWRVVHYSGKVIVEGKVT
jgi:hypothetical protein